MLENAGVLPKIQKQDAGPDAAMGSDANTSTASATKIDKAVATTAKGGGTQAAKKGKRRKGGKKKSKK